MSPAPSWRVLLVTHLAAAALAWHLSPKEILDERIRQDGVFSTTTEHVLAATVLSLRSESKLLSFTYRGEAHVSVDRSKYWLLHARENLTIQASIGYYVDLAKLTSNRVRYDAGTKVVTVSLPPLLMGDIAFEPELAQETASGLLSYSPSTVENLRRFGYQTAKAAFIKQAQGATLVEAAQRQAKEDVERAFSLPLVVVGHPEVKVVATFEADR